MEQQARIRVIGSYAKALVVTADRIPQPGETLLGWGYRETYGGKGSDMAVQAARLGAEVEYVGVVGDDAFGQEFVELMAAEGVDTRHVRVDPQRPTGVGLIVKDVLGRNIIVVDKGANDLFTPDDVDAAFGDPGVATGEVPDVVLAQLEIPLDTALHALARGRRVGSRTVLNPAPAADLRDRDLSMVDVLTPNQTEARVLLGLDPGDDTPYDDLATRLLDLGAGAIVITKGEEGARVYERVGAAVEATPVAPWPVEVVDSNGAGDSFNAALSVALAEGRSLVDAATYAGAVAGLCCEGWETVPSYRGRAAVETYLARQQGHRTMEGAVS